MTIATANGQANPQHIEDKLVGEPLTEGYKPTLPLWALGAMGDWSMVPQLYLLRDVELMMIHPVVRSSLNYFKGGIAGAEFDVQAQDERVGAFVLGLCQRFWDRGVPKIQGGYEYGWIGCENLYCEENGQLVWDGLRQFSPRDVYLLTQDNRPVGVRVKRVQKSDNDPHNPDAQQIDRIGKARDDVDLWLATDEIPAKGLWYAHDPRYSNWYGQSQLLGAWRPWRRLAWKDGAETNIDGGFYRFFYAGPVVKYPEEDYQASVGAPATSLDSQGRPRRYARDMARMIAEWYKSGAGVGIPSSRYTADMGGGDKWGLELPKSTLNISGGVEYVKHLWDQISQGVGVPPELMAAAETGSGYSGRAIPMEGFLMVQQRLADAMLLLFVNQVLRPLVHWNFGPQQWDAKVKNLIETKRASQTGQPGATPPGQPGAATPGAGTRPSGLVPTPPTPGYTPKGAPGTQWSAYTGEGGQQGWKSQGGRVLYQPQRPGAGLSLEEAPERIQDIVRKILQRAA